MVGGMRVGTNHPKTDRETSPSKDLATKENSAEYVFDNNFRITIFFILNI